MGKNQDVPRHPWGWEVEVLHLMQEHASGEGVSDTGRGLVGRSKDEEMVIQRKFAKGGPQQIHPGIRVLPSNERHPAGEGMGDTTLS